MILGLIACQKCRYDVSRSAAFACRVEPCPALSEFRREEMAAEVLGNNDRDESEA